MRTPILSVLLCACAPVVATIDPLDEVETAEEPTIEDPETAWTGAWVPGGLDRIWLRGDRAGSCLWIGLVLPIGWPSDYDVEVEEPWGVETALWSDAPCPSAPGEGWAGRPLATDGLAGRIDIRREWPPAEVTLDLAVQVADTAWEEDVVIELAP